MNYIQNSKKLNSTSTNYASERLIDNLKTAGDMAILKRRKKPPMYEIWREDEEINKIILERKGI